MSLVFNNTFTFISPCVVTLFTVHNYVCFAQHFLFRLGFHKTDIQQRKTYLGDKQLQNDWSRFAYSTSTHTRI